MTCTIRRSFSVLVLSLLSLVLLMGTAAHADISREPSNPFTLERGLQKRAPEMARHLQAFATSKGLKVLWWNIAHGDLASDGFTNFITENITSLSRSKAAPDVFLFGEYSPSALDQDAKAELTKSYPFQAFLPYSQLEKERGIAIFSRRPFRSGREHVLNWKPPGLSASSTKEYLSTWGAGLGPNTVSFYTRTVREVIVETERGPITIVPIHLSEPWHSLRIRDGAIKGGVHILDEMVLGKTNPIINQIRDLVTWLPAGGNPSLVVIGDFNMPSDVFGFKTVGFKLLSRSLRTVNLGSENTFPTPSSPLIKKYPSVQIDHAFAAGSIHATSGAVLPWMGSDHFPIYSVFN